MATRKKGSRTMADSKSSKKLFKRKSFSYGKKATLNKLRDELDYWFGRYVRATACDDSQMSKCYTCDKVLHVSEVRAGHFISRRFLATRWDLDNVRPQCYNCDHTMQGMQWEFGRRLDEEMEGKANEIAQRSKSKSRLTHGVLKAAIEHYSSEVERISKEKGLTWNKRK